MQDLAPFPHQAEPLLATLKQSTAEKSAMFMSDIWPISGLLVGTAVAVAATPVQAADNYILGRCSVSSPDSGVGVNPTINGDSYLVSYHAGDPRYQGFSFNSSDTKVTLVKAPAHGKVERVNSKISNNNYLYMPNEGYFGQDMFVMQVEKNGVNVRIHYLMEVVHEGEPTTYIGDDGERHGQYCNPDAWKISSTTPALDTSQRGEGVGALPPEHRPGERRGRAALVFPEFLAQLPGPALGRMQGLDK